MILIEFQVKCELYWRQNEPFFSFGICKWLICKVHGMDGIEIVWFDFPSLSDLKTNLQKRCSWIGRWLGVNLANEANEPILIWSMKMSVSGVVIARATNVIKEKSDRLLHSLWTKKLSEKMMQYNNQTVRKSCETTFHRKTGKNPAQVFKFDLSGVNYFRNF